MQEKRKQVGIYGGSFDPVHLGHLNLAIALQEAHGLDELYFIPARISPHKDAAPGASFEHRVAMLKLAVQGIPGAQVLTLEGERQGPSYTIDTVNTLRTSEANADFHLLLGEDSLARLHEWKRIDELLAAASPYIGTRRAELVDLSRMPPNVRDAVQRGLTQTALFDISATDIRQRLLVNKTCKHLLPEKVLDYIQRFALYSF